jgi:ubiquitin thioesterase CYLD
MCTICGSLATHECRACYGKFTDRGGLCSGADSTAFCTDCLSRVHSRSDRSAHSAHFTPLSNSFNLDNTNTAKGEFPRLTMDLFAVICIETSHFVSFVKCGTDRLAPWVFFDSMADRVEVLHGTGHNVPQVSWDWELGPLL